MWHQPIACVHPAVFLVYLEIKANFATRIMRGVCSVFASAYIILGVWFWNKGNGRILLLVDD